MNFKFDILNKYLKKDGDGVLLLSEINRNWLVDFKTSYGFILLNKNNECIFITDKRYFDAAKSKIESNLNNVKVWAIDQNNTLLSLLNKAKQDLKIDNILIEEEYITLQQFKLINQCFDKISTFSSREIRAIKTDEELKKLQDSANIVVKVIEWLKTVIKPGMSEIEVAKMISIKILELGAEGNSFSPIVAAGLNGANPHHKPSDYKIKDGDFVTIDIGCMYQGFASDITRTFVVGKKANNLEMVDIYNLVLKSQLEGVKNANININGVKLDCVCRDVIDNSIYKGLFVHGTGHGVGMEVHELPNVNSSNKNNFITNNVVTIEPGIYKKGVGGVRIEDTIVIKENGCLVLTNTSKELEYVDNK